MPLLPLLLAAAPQSTLPPAPPTYGPARPYPTTWVRTGAAPDAGGGCSPLANGGFHNGLFAWDTEASAGAPPGAVALVGGAAELSENASFLTTLSQGLCVPPDAEALAFDLVSTDFDLASGGFPDAFEVSLLDGAFGSVVPTWDPAATSFFNVQEDGTQLVAPGVDVAPAPGVVARVRLDLAALAPALSAADDLVLYFDLIGADGDAGSRVAVDDVLFETSSPGVSFCEGVACPCGNDAPGRGCANSTGQGALLEALGSASLQAGDLTLHASGMPQNFAVFILAADEACSVLGDGYLAVQPGIYQPGVLRASIQLVDANGTATLGPDAVSAIEAGVGMPGLITSGSTWFLQVAYRDEPTSPCGTRFNLTNGVRVTFVD